MDTNVFETNEKKSNVRWISNCFPSLCHSCGCALPRQTSTTARVLVALNAWCLVSVPGAVNVYIERMKDDKERFCVCRRVAHPNLYPS